MTTETSRLAKMAKAVTLGIAVVIGASYFASCTPKYKQIFTPMVPSGRDKLDILYGEK